MRHRSRVATFGLVAASAVACPAAASERVVDVPLAGGTDQRVLIAAPPAPRAAIVMLPGGTGDIGLTRDGDIRHDHNFVVRTRAAWKARGYAVLIPDTVDHASLRGQHSTPAYARRVTALIALARRQTGAPVFLLGTSQGAIAAMNGAAHARPGTLAGLVLTESVSVPGGSGETVFDADPAAVRVPALVIANRADRCRVAPPGAAPRIAAALRRSPDVAVVHVDGGTTRGDDDCGSLTPHGYAGIEDEVIGRIAAWIDRHGARRK